MGPEPRGPHRAPSPILTDHGQNRLGLLLAFLALVAIAALVAFIVVRLADRRPPPPMFAPLGAPMAPPHDEALATLRLRYARGEISRTDYLQASADLGAAPGEPPPTTGP